MTTPESSRKGIPYFMSKSRGALWFHPAWGVRTAVGKVGWGGDKILL
jgi:hypothetical protein